ncbi:MAG: adenylate/guanylate cyclase domain-containing protein, partial [Cyclobacteriaceae bacterium]
RINYYICVSLLLLAMPGLAQNSEIENLKKEIANQADDTLKVNSLIKLSSHYLGENPKESIRYGLQGQQLAKKISFPKGEAYSYKAIGLGYFYEADYPEAIIQFERSLQLFDSIKFQVGVANILSSLGSAYFNGGGKDAIAIDFFLRSLKISEELKDSLRIGTAMNGIGNIYANKQDTQDKALDYYLMAHPIFRKINYEEGEGIVAMNIGEIYKKKNLYDSAILYLDQSLDIYRGTVDACFPLNLLGEIYADLGDFKQALQYQNKALEIAKGLDAKLEMSQSLIGIATTQKKMKNYSLAIPFYHQAENLAEEISAKVPLKEAYEGLARAYAKTGDFKKAYAYDTLFSSIKDTLYNVDNDKKIQQLQFNSDLGKKEAEISLLTADQALKDATIQRQKIVNYAAVITGFLLVLVVAGFYNRYRYVRKTNKIIKNERDRSQELLLNILPEETARELESNGYAKTRFYDNVTVLFTDFKGFSTIAGNLTPIELVAELNDYFMAFDEIMGKYNLEKIKTIGDAYMCAGGIPTVNETHPLDAVHAALAMQAYMEKRQREKNITGIAGWELRIGIHTGPVVAGVVGKKKYAYDIWGDTVNIASRMESNGEPGKVNISASTYHLISEHYQCLYRGKISAKNIGEVDMYFVESKINKPVLQSA